MTIIESESAVYYDPYDFEIDSDPYPVWKRLRDEAPLYYNDRYGFYALSRYADVEKALGDWRSYSSAKGTVLEQIKSNMEIEPGWIIFEDPVAHDLHRGLLSRVFAPKRMAAVEPKVRDFCARSLDHLVGSGGFDFIADLGAQVPMRTIGLLLGIPEDEQEALRDQIDEGLRLEEGTMPDPESQYLRGHERAAALEGYIDWRAEHPSDDLMTELLQAEFDDVDGVRRRLSRQEVINYVNLLAAAGNETTTRLIGWVGKVLADFPDQRRVVAENRDLVPNCIEELLRYENPSPVNSRYVVKDVEVHGQVVREGSAMVCINGAANRDERAFDDPDRFDVRRKIGRHITFGYGVHFCLGSALARLEGRVALDEVLSRFPTWEVDWDHAVRARTSTVRGLGAPPRHHPLKVGTIRRVNPIATVGSHIVDRTLQRHGARREGHPGARRDRPAAPGADAGPGCEHGPAAAGTVLRAGHRHRAGRLCRAAGAR